jgi:tetratricopeptide (TPR) repeat protein
VSASAELEQALEAKRAGRLDEAVIALEGFLARWPSHALALAHLADVQLRRRRPADAAAALDRAEQLAGVTAYTSRLRGEVHYKARRWREAARCYREADALGDRSAWTLVQLARCEAQLGDLDAARAAAARATERDERSGSAWVMLGELAARAGRDDEALGHFEQAHEKAPGDQYAYAKLIEARLRRLPAEERAREVQVLLRGGGEGNRHLLAVLARLRSEGGDDERAADAWRTRRERHGDLYARKMEGYALRKAGQQERAAAVLASCLLEDPEDLILFRTYVHLQRSRGALDELRATLEQLVPVAGTRQGAVFGELKKLDR